ncbi:peptide ABC transporter substrate-binding protein [Brevibacillus centrosporus]|uniref:peptide ABC transporter substrate-binding protein n=1 Tax=Brevibacillus centrosporus TaxID=54910 RepID=UPI0011447EA0|nr:peptide ABC transporter substrate-binding protein [Brevibacillus centrosporus]MEC2127835.1 peptide ABC transporter substrate-binding protein [Brevibacillus centrosporus]GED32075.1 dipeptide-binding protein DppE [Brevibacillus centrosporus]
MIKKVIRYSLLLSLLILTGCSQSTNAPQIQTGTPNTESSSNIKNTSQTLKINAKTEPPSLNPALIDNQSAGDIANQLFEGLVRVDKNGEIVPGVAEKWDVSDDKTVYTFHLRQDAKWSNGEPVTAEDFVYSWEKALRPDTGAPLADNLSFIKNGSKYLGGEIKDPTALGIKAINPQTLQVTLERPTPFFLRLTSFFSVLPINKKLDESNPNWSGEAASFVSNGPFMMKEWKHDQEIVMVPNPQYWAKDSVKLQSIEWKMVNDQNTEYQMYQTGELDIAYPPTSATAKLLTEGKAKTVPVARTAYVRYNHKDSLFANQKIRKAFASAIDRKILVDKVVQGGQTPATALIPEGLSSGNGDFRTQAGTDQFTGYSVEEAKKLLDEGLNELNQASLPKVTFLTDNNDLRSKISQALQEMWKRNLGVEVEIKSMERKVFVQSVKAGEFQFALYSTGADYDDSYNLFGQFTTGDGYNYSKYSNPEYDKFVKAAFQETDPAKRAQEMIEAEKVLMNDMAINPLYYDKLVILENERVKNVYRFAVSALDLREAFVE